MSWLPGPVLSLVRRGGRGLRRVPLVRSVIFVRDGLLWARRIESSGEVDAAFVAAQLGKPSLSESRAALLYSFGAHRRGVSVHPGFDEVYARAALHSDGRVPAFYLHLLNSEAGGRDAQQPAVSRERALAAAREWAAGSGEFGFPPDRVAVDASTVVLQVSGADADVAARIRVAAQAGDHLVVVAAGVEASVWVSITAALAGYAGGFAVLLSRAEDIEAGVARVLPPTGAVVVVDPRALPTVDQLIELRDAARPGFITIPVDRASDDTVEAAGSGGVDGWRISLLAGLPVEDLDGLGADVVAVPCRASSTAAFVVSGSDPVANRVWLNPRIRVRMRAARSILSTRSSTRRDDRDLIVDLYRRSGYEIADWRDGIPQLRRVSPRPRWAVKVASLAGAAGDVWGDSHFGDALAQALRRRGHEVVVDRREAANRPSVEFDDVHLVVRGPTRIHPPRHGVRVLWIISHPHEITADELAEFDIVFAASASWSAEASRRFGRQILPLFECTDATLYRPSGRRRGTDILFVGKSRDVPRRVVMAPIEAGIAVRVYGPDWGAFIPDSAVVAPFAPLSALPAMYEEAGAVLNDQWAEMRAAGFPAMRPFDVIAAGGRVISEEVEGLRELLGPGVVTYEHENELVDLLRDPDLDVLFPSDTELREHAERVRRDHSFDARSAVIEDAVLQRHRDVAREEGK